MEQWKNGSLKNIHPSDDTNLIEEKEKNLLGPMTR